ncbi:MAG: acylphosphatase [Methylococcaceae bacterium]|nr:acylphosphatase [Methylococcaceae bacterium]
MQHFKITVKGRVQGVSFRAFTLKSAKKHIINGTVKNCANGDVEIIASGTKQAMQLFIQDCRKGSLFAKVTDLDITELGSPTELEPNFRIIDR